MCFWREPADAEWGIAAADRGGHGLFELLVEGTPEAYRNWAEEYYETDVSLPAVEHVYALRPLTPVIVTQLNPEVELADLDLDIDEIGYPR